MNSPYQQSRDFVRTELGIQDKLVIGHIGRFCEQKNQEFLIDIFSHVLDYQKKCRIAAYWRRRTS